MKRNVYACFQAALVLVGWLAFGWGLAVHEPLGLKIALLSAARVLP